MPAHGMAGISEPAVLIPDADPALNPDLDRLSRRTLLGRAGATAMMAAGALTNADSQSPQDIRAIDDSTIEKAELTYPSEFNGVKTNVKAFLAVPKRGGKRGAVLVVHEIFGLTDHIRDVACRIARAGYTSIAVDLFSREGAPPPMSGGFGPLMEFVGKIQDRQIFADLEAGMKFLRERADANGKVGIIGFCWGGRIAMLFDAAAPRLNAAVAYYGRVSGQKTENQPAYPIDVADHMHCPLLCHFGAKDTAIPPSEAEKLRKALKAHHKAGEVYVYEGAGHAFNNDTRESYVADAAKLAWSRTLDWYDKYLRQASENPESSR